MRTTASTAALPLHLLRQGAFTNETYAAQTPVIWQHSFLSAKRMTNWSEGAPVFLAWVAGSKVTRKRGCATRVANPVSIDAKCFSSGLTSSTVPLRRELGKASLHS
jgi:hypothetical protein